MQNDLIAFKEKLDSVNDLLILIANNPSHDTMAGALSLYLSLSAAGKLVNLMCETQPTVRDSHLVGVDKIKSDLGGQNLVITVNVEGDVVDKVTSAVNDGKLSLTIVPKAGQQSISKDNIIFGSSGASSELTIVVGASNLSNIGNIASTEADFFAHTALVNISNSQGSFGQINLVDESSSLCELVTALLQELKLPLSQDIASNLMQGIEEATNNLQSENMTADTFEALAILYRSGARHRAKVIMPTATIIDNTPIIEELKQEDQKDIAAIESELQSMTKTINPEPDWLKPKIFTSSSDK